MKNKYLKQLLNDYAKQYLLWQMDRRAKDKRQLKHIQCKIINYVTNCGYKAPATILHSEMKGPW